MKVLVTGSEGSLMQAIIPRLLEQRHEVVGVDSFFRYGRQDRKRAYEFIEGDLSESKFAETVVSPDTNLIIQGAARIFGVSGFHAYPADILSRDVTLHQNILWAAKDLKHLDRVVYISSSMVYERCEKIPSTESDVEDMRIPFTDYGLSKLVGERLSRAFQKQYGIPYTIWRPFNIITPFETAEEEQGFAHVFADLINRLIVEKRNPLSVLGDGEQIRCFTWIDDVASAIAKYSFSKASLNQAFNLGNEEPIKMLDLARLIFEAGQRKGIIPRDRPLSFDHKTIFSDDVRIRVPSAEKARKLLGWEPTTKVKEAVDRCVDQIMLANR